MIYVLDTNAVSALMRANAAFVERLASHAPGTIAIPQPVIAEIAFGIERLLRSKRRKALQSRFDLICAEIPRMEWTDTVSQAYGRIKAALERRGSRIEGLRCRDRGSCSREWCHARHGKPRPHGARAGAQIEDWSQ